MRIEFIDKDNGPKNLIGEAEILFEPEDGILAGTKLVGISLWRTEKGETSVTMPSRSWGGWGRTSNLPVNSRALCQLSYTPRLEKG